MDDGNLIDADAAKDQGPELIQLLFILSGAPLKPEKRHDMAATGECLGLAHDFRSVHVDGTVPFWPSQELVAELDKLLPEMKVICAPATASKFRGARGGLQ